jgi:hypothetical protein
VIAGLLYVVGGARIQAPNLERFLDGKGTGYYSPPLLAAIRKHGESPEGLAEDPARA